MKSILFFAYYFPPSDSIGSKRTYSFYKYLKENDFKITVITNSYNSNKENNNDIIYFGNDTIRFKNSATFKRLKFNIDPYFRSLDRSIFSKYFFKSLKYLFQFKKKYDYIIVSYRPSCVIILGIIFKIIFRSKLIIDLRDLISIQGHKKKIFLINSIDNLIDKIFISFADEIITVSPTCSLKCKKFYKRGNTLIYNGIDSPIISNFNKNINKNIITIFYAGSVNNTRTFFEITNYIKKINDIQKIKLIVASKDSPFLYGAEQLYTEWIGFISNDILSNFYLNCHYLLLLEGNDVNSKENIPAKIFDYLSYGKPILINCFEDSDSVNLLKKTGRGFLVNNFDDFKNVISNYDQITFKVNIDYLKREFQNKSLLTILK